MPSIKSMLLFAAGVAVTMAVINRVAMLKNLVNP